MDAISKALDEYQNWTVTTAVYPESLAAPYLALGLGDEAGELLEKASEAWSLARLDHDAREGLLAEGGDVMWYLAQLSLSLNMPLSLVWSIALQLIAQFEATALGIAIEVSMASSAAQGRIKKQLRDGALDREKVLYHLARVMRAMNALAAACDTSLIAMLSANRAKLTSRLERGKIKGEGDAR